MPVVFREGGYRFHFFANEGDPREPLHVHISSAGAKAKFWLLPDVELAYNRGYDAKTIKHLQMVVIQRRTELEEAWHDFFS